MQNIAKTFKLAVCQIKVVPVKQETLQFAKQSIEQAAQNGAKIAVLGETFNCLYTPSHCKEAAEDFNKLEECTTLNLLSELSKKHQMYICGSIPERENDKLYNTCVFFNKEGKLQTKFRKMHLFDIDIPGNTYKESNTFAPGNELVVAETEIGTFGLGICYDVRFPEFSQALCSMGAKILLFPANFSPKTGPLHFELLLRGRAIDNLSYVVGASTRRYVEDPSVYQAYGHSTIIDPMGKVVEKLNENEGIIYHEISNEFVDSTRQQIPIYNQKRNDIYNLTYNKQ